MGRKENTSKDFLDRLLKKIKNWEKYPMLSYRDLYTLRAAVVNGHLDQEQMRQTLSLVQNPNRSLEKVVANYDLLSDEEWQKLLSQSQRILVQSQFDHFFQKENKEIFKRLQPHLSPKETESILNCLREANQQGVGMLTLALDRKILSPQELEGEMEIRFEVKLICPQGHGEFLLDHYFPWRDYPCPLCQSDLELIENGQPKKVPLPQPGDRWDRYQIIKKLGQGGMGAVYKARDTELDRLVALKVLTDAQDKENQWRRFQREMRLLAQLNHRHIVSVYDWGKVNGLPYFTLAYIRGMDLSQYVETKGRLSQKETLEIAIQVGEALDYAHGQEIIHRDLKPENIMIDREGKAYLMDFGLAREVSSENQSITQTGVILGSPAFMSPEQAQGERILDASTDIYALGGVIYFMLAGKPTFQARDVFGLLRKIVNEPPTPLRSLRRTVTPEVETLVLKCLAKDPTNRYQTARLVVEDLERAQNLKPISGRLPRKQRGRKRARKGRKRNEFSLITAILATLVIVFSLFLGIHYLGESSQDPTVKGDRPKEGENLSQKAEKKEDKEGQKTRGMGVEKKDPPGEKKGLEKENKKDDPPDKTPSGQDLLEKGKKLYQQKNYRASLKVLKRAEKIQPTNASIPLYKGANLLALNRRKEALSEANRALEINPEFISAISLKGMIYTYLGDYEKAIEAFDRGVQLAPQKAGVVSSRGAVYFKMKKFSQALSDFSRALKLEPKNGKNYYQRGRTYLKLKKYSQALADFNRALNLGFQNAACYTQRGRALYFSNRLNLALSDFNRALKLNPEYAQALFNKGVLYQHKKDFDRAVRNYDQSLKINPNQYKAWNNRGAIYMKKNQFEKAFRDLSHSIKLKADYYSARYHRMQVAFRLQKFAFAERDLSAMIQINPKASAYYLRGQARYKQKKYKKALKDFNTAFQKGYQNKYLHSYRGDCNLKLGRHRQAVQIFKLHLKSYPQDPQAPVIKKYIRQREKKRNQ